MAYQIEFAKLVKTHLEVLTAAQRSTVLAATERQLTNEPSKETSEAAPPQPGRAVGAACARTPGILRGERRATAVVRVLAVGVKTREALQIGGEEIKL